MSVGSLTTLSLMNFSNPLTWLLLPVIFVLGPIVVPFTTYLVGLVVTVLVVYTVAHNMSKEDTRPNV